MSKDQSGSLNGPQALTDLTQLKRRAKELVRAFKRGDTEAAQTVDRHFDGADPERFRLAQAQLVLARGIGFPSWTRLRDAVDVASGLKRTRRPRTRPGAMVGKTYIHDIDPIDADRAWDLFEACRDGDAEKVRTLLDADPKLIHAQHWYTQPIHFAVYANHPEIVRILLAAGAEPGRSRFMYAGWRQLLERAEQWGFDEVRDILRDAIRERFGFDPDCDGLAQAIRSRDRSPVESLIAERASLAAASDDSGNNAIHWAVMTRQPDLFELFVSHGADPNHRRSDGQTPAQLLVNGDYEFRTWRELKGLDHPDEKTVLRALLDAGADYGLSVACAAGDAARVSEILANDPDAARRLDSGRRNPLSYAARFGHVEIVRTLLTHRADPNTPEEQAPDGQALWNASAYGHVEVVKLLLEYGANPNSAPDSSDCCLGIARSRLGDNAGPIVALLEEHGAHTPIWYMSVDELRVAIETDAPITRDPYFVGETLARNDVELAKLLLERRPDLVDTLHGGGLRMGSPDVAITESSMLKLLLDAGFDPNRPDWLGKTALHHYAGRGETGNALLVLEHGADIDAIDDEFHGTPLAWAAAEGHEETVRLLLEHGANRELPEDPTQARPVARARTEGHSKIVKLLEQVAASGR